MCNSQRVDLKEDKVWTVKKVKESIFKKMNGAGEVNIYIHT